MGDAHHDMTPIDRLRIGVILLESRPALFEGGGMGDLVDDVPMLLKDPFRTSPFERRGEGIPEAEAVNRRRLSFLAEERR